MSTRILPAREQFDFWRAAFPEVNIQPRNNAGPRRFHGSVLRFESAAGAALNKLSCDSNTARFKPEREAFLLGVAQSPGRIRYRCGDTDRELPVGALYLMDTARQPQFTSDAFTNRFITLPRHIVDAALATDDRMEDGVMLLSESPLTRMLKAHLYTSTRELDEMSEPAAQLLLQNGLDLASLIFREQDQPGAANDVRSGAVTIRAARQLIDAHLEYPGLNLTHIAQGLQSTPRRVQMDFERNGLAFSRELRIRRMRRAAELLQTTPAPIGEIALACGYMDFSAFSRAFREHHGLSPRDYRISYRLSTGGS